MEVLFPPLEDGDYERSGSYQIDGLASMVLHILNY